MTAHRFAQLAVAGAGLLALANSFASSALADPLGHTCGALESACVPTGRVLLSE